MRRVAITGFGVVSAIGNDKETFWDSLAKGKSGIAAISHFNCESYEVQLAAEVKNMKSVPDQVAELAQFDPKTAFAYEACRQALDQAGVESFDNKTLLHLATSLECFDFNKVVQYGCVDFKDIIEQYIKEKHVPLQVPLDMAVKQLCQIYGRPGRKLTNCSACAASSQAIGHAFTNIRNGNFERAVCGGFDSMINPLGVGGFQLLQALTTSNERGSTACRPFDSSRNGAVLGEGAAVFVLEPLENAIADGKEILAEICGYGSTLDAYNLSAPDPNGDGAVRAMKMALKNAGIQPYQINHINTHGTGTHLNDKVEAKAIREVFADNWGTIPISSTKSMTGHLIGAAGAIEVGSVLSALYKGVIPPNPSLTNVGTGCELNHVKSASKFEGQYALSNSFGFGGQNAALILRKYTKGK